MRRFLATLIPALGLAATVAGCSPPKPPPQIETRPAAPLQVERPFAPDPQGSPLAFRWLGDGAVLVAPTSGQRALGELGDYVARAATKFPRARLSVWDDEAAWRAANDGADDEEALSHKRAEYLKEPAPESVDRFLVFDRHGNVVYQRDFRAYPLTELEG